MELWAFIFCLAPVFGFSNNFAGEFKTILESVDNRDSLPRGMADWHIFLKRKNRKDKTVDGWFRVKKTVVEPLILYETLVWSNGKFIKMAIDQLTKMSLCDEEIKNNFYYPVFEGNMTWSPSCVLSPGHMRFKKGKEFDVDGLIHKVIQKTFYGKFKVIGTVVDNKKNVVGGLSIIVTTVRKTD